MVILPQLWSKKELMKFSPTTKNTFHAFSPLAERNHNGFPHFEGFTGLLKTKRKNPVYPVNPVKKTQYKLETWLRLGLKNIATVGIYNYVIPVCC